MDLKFFTPERLPFLTALLLHARLSWSIRLRWLAVIGFFGATWLSSQFFKLPINYEQIWATLLVLAGINLVYWIILKLFDEISLITEVVLLSIHIVLDLVFLTVLVHLTGGIENPIYFFYVFHVVLSSILFPRWMPLVFASIVVFLFSGLVFLEARGILHHHNVFGTDLHQNTILEALMVIVFTITVYVTAYICMTFMRIFRDSKRIIDIQNKKLLDADKQKSQFFMFASHELKSPIIVLKSTIDAIIKSYKNTMEEKPLKLLGRASERAGQMLEIIKELLELSKDHKTIDKKEYCTVLLNSLIEEIIYSEQPGAEHRNIRINQQFESDSDDVKIMGRKTDLERIFLNLINNAVRYTDEGGSVSIKTTVKEKQFVFTVIDTGIGIKEEDFPKIFTEFYRSENARKAVNYGTGLGLSLVKKLVESYDGTIAVQSEVDKGTIFTVTLPIN